MSNNVLDWIKKRLGWSSDESTPVSINDYGFHLSAFSEKMTDDQSVFTNIEKRFFDEVEQMKKLKDSPYSSSIFAEDDRRGYYESKIDERRFLGKIKRRR